MQRRHFLQAVSASAAFGLLSPFSRAFAADADAHLEAMLQRHTERFLQRSPETATNYNYDTGAHAALRSQLDDRSLAAIARDRGAVAQAIAELSTIDRRALSPSAALDYDVARFVYEDMRETLDWYGYVDIDLRPSPYVVSQMNGTYYWLPDFIGSRHPLESKADVDAYLARLSALGTALDQETERIRHDAALGVIPPDFIIAKTLAQLTDLRDSAPATTPLIGPALKRAAANQLGGFEAPADKIFRERVAPALSRQIDAFKGLQPKAVSDAGVWRLPNGDAYYETAVRSNTTADIKPAALHESGQAQVQELLAEIDRSLRAQGMTQGSVGARISALNHDPRFQVPDNDQGREQLLAQARHLLDDIRARLPRAFGKVVVDPLIVRRTPVAIEGSAPGAYYDPGAGDQPGIFSLNLKRPSDLAVWRLPTLAYHEGIPGHHFQGSVLKHAGALPLFRKVVRFSAYSEGWGLYAEQVADELGVYENDPFGRIGYLQSELFRAARIVVDTGIHYKRWTRQQAIDWMVTTIGDPVVATTREVERYCVYPGQACSFKVGANSIVAAREAARAKMGKRFDVRQFHDLVLNSGPMPMNVLTQLAAQWSAQST
ncbi:DUF885 domain-containing protein [Solimonas marina]|uniref:DUF885 domain-containing protein n=1 Tax=Solimonas marina TaxID=2714601 RepID=A0A970B6G9_9GAMM|nr:DUF885 domain-containing protein [Solimonas marina]NKF22610.1 DUF885 domain-containing protein [Solimonas marina]